MNSSFNDKQKPTYTADDLAQVHDILKRIGYLEKPEGAYYPEEKFSDCLVDHVKLDAGGEMAGVVTLHLDPDNSSGQDGRVTVARDHELARITGRATTVYMFAAMGEIILQRLVSKKPAVTTPAIEIKPA